MDGMNAHEVKTPQRVNPSRNEFDPLFPMLIMAINPALIMTMVGSLVFFLLHLTYAGEFETRIHYVFTLFVFATVLIARIAIEEGKEHALPFGLALATAIGLVLLRFQLNAILTVLLVSTVWWCVHRLTWDCTVLANDPEGHGEGLLQSIRKERGVTKGTPNPSSRNISPAKSHDASPNAVAGRWWWIVAGAQQRPQAPGSTILWFALAAFPIFGIGSLFAVSERGARQYAFLLFFAYLASGLGLLVTTGLLRLRQYLKKRHVELSTQTTGSWLIAGGGLALFLLIASMVFPRPGAEYSISRPPAWPRLNREAPRGTSPVAVGKDCWEERQDTDRSGHPPASSPSEASPNRNTSADPSPAETGQSKSESESKSESQTKNGPAGQAAEKTQQPSAHVGSGSGQEQGDQEKGDTGRESEPPQQDPSAKATSPAETPQVERDSQPRSEPAPHEDAQEPAKQSQPESKNDTAPTGSSDAPQIPIDFSVGNLFQWLVHTAFWVIVAVLAWHTRHNIAAALLDLWQAWKALFHRSRPLNSTEPKSTTVLQPVRRFADCQNPFRQAPNLPPAVIVRTTLEAVEIWAEERGYKRSLDQTVDDFARQLSLRRKDLQQELSLLLELHTQLAYAGQTVSAQEALRLRGLWRILGRSD